MQCTIKKTRRLNKFLPPCFHTNRFSSTTVNDCSYKIFLTQKEKTPPVEFCGIACFNVKVFLFLNSLPYSSSAISFTISSIAVDAPDLFCTKTLKIYDCPLLASK